MRLRRGKAGLAPHPENDRPRPSLPALGVPLVGGTAGRFSCQPSQVVKNRKTRPWGRCPHLPRSRPRGVRAGGEKPPPPLPGAWVTSRASSPRVLAASGCGPRQGLDPLSVPKGVMQRIGFYANTTQWAKMKNPLVRAGLRQITR